MDIPFKPSLLHMCIVKVTLRLHYDREIKRMRNEEIIFPFHDGKGPWFSQPRHEHWEKIEKLALEKVHFLPRLLRTKVVSLLRPMAQQVEHWRQKHFFFERGDADIPLETFLCWKMDGSIDAEVTAKKIVRNVNLDRNTRYCMAILYFMEDEIFSLFNGVDVEILFCTNVIKAAWFWRRYFLRRCKRHWTEAIKSCDFRRCKWERVSGFFRFLPHDVRLHCTKNLRFPNSDDLMCCLSQIDDQERLELFNSDPTLLSSLLKWPLQIYFIDMANKLWSRMTVKHFGNILRIILDEYLLEGLHDFDYLQLFREFWSLSPPSIKEEIKNRPIFQFIEVTLNYNSETETLSLPDVLRKLKLSNIKKAVFNIFDG